jgi:hypothetical protein
LLSRAGWSVWPREDVQPRFRITGTKRDTLAFEEASTRIDDGRAASPSAKVETIVDGTKIVVGIGFHGGSGRAYSHDVAPGWSCREFRVVNLAAVRAAGGETVRNRYEFDSPVAVGQRQPGRCP